MSESRPPHTKGENPRQRVFLGEECWNCHTRNTAIEVYTTTVEGVCLSCARPQELSREVIDAHRPRKDKDSDSRVRYLS